MSMMRRRLCAWLTAAPSRRCTLNAPRPFAWAAAAQGPWGFAPEPCLAGVPAASSQSPRVGGGGGVRAVWDAVAGAAAGSSGAAVWGGAARAGAPAGGPLADLLAGGMVFLGKNSRVPKKANHGARPCSHYGRKHCRHPKKYRVRSKLWIGSDRDPHLPAEERLARARWVDAGNTMPKLDRGMKLADHRERLERALKQENKN